MAVLRASEGVRINSKYSTLPNVGGVVHSSTRTWSAYQSGINMFQFTQSAATSTRTTIAVFLRWACIRTAPAKTELPILYAVGRGSLNTNGTISADSFDWQAWGGNGILWPYFGMGGSSLFIGADSGAGTGIIGSVYLHIACLELDKLTINAFSD